MALRMADGPVANLPPGLDAYAGYVDDSGIGVTWPQVQQLPALHHLSISVHGAKAMCADVESGALSSWSGYDYGYCSISRAQQLINLFGRPKKLWTAHQDPALGAHLCTPACGFGFRDRADGTQWIDHGGWDESLLADDFFSLAPAPPAVPVLPREVEHMIVGNDHNGNLIVVGTAKDDGDLLVFTQKPDGSWSVTDVTDAIKGANPADTRLYQLL